MTKKKLNRQADSCYAVVCIYIINRKLKYYDIDLLYNIISTLSLNQNI